MAADKKPRVRRKRRTSATVMLLNAIMTIVVLVILVFGGLIFYGVTQFNKPGSNDTAAPFLVEKGASVATIAGRLQDQGFIDNALLFRGAYQLSRHEAGGIQSGQYTVPANASMSDILTLLTTTKPQEFFVNVVPGETSAQVADALNDPSVNLTGDLVSPPPEGSLLAVRHDFFPGDTRQSVVDAMQKKMQDQLAQIWAGHDPSIDDVIKTPEQLVTMASLVEKETGVDSERPEVASVFLNRLRKHMRLQTDPSVIYGITQGKAKLDRELTSKDLGAKTAYNTYQIDGLPPGPIANPGADALNAVAHPAKTTFLYFVAKTADPADGHLFSSTYAEHKKNVTLYRKAAQEDAAEQAKDLLEQQQASEAGDTTQ